MRGGWLGSCIQIGLVSTHCAQGRHTGERRQGNQTPTVIPDFCSPHAVRTLPLQGRGIGHGILSQATTCCYGGIRNLFAFRGLGQQRCSKGMEKRFSAQFISQKALQGVIEHFKYSVTQMGPIFHIVAVQEWQRQTDEQCSTLYQRCGIVPPCISIVAVYNIVTALLQWALTD